MHNHHATEVCTARCPSAGLGDFVAYRGQKTVPETDDPLAEALPCNNWDCPPGGHSFDCPALHRDSVRAHIANLEAAHWTRLERSHADAARAAAAVDAVRGVHRPEERCHDGSGEWSVSREEWDDEEHDGEPEVFLVCAECGSLEVSDQAPDAGYRDSQWPCRTVRALGID
jgi:hypothetical protein